MARLFCFVNARFLKVMNMLRSLSNFKSGSDVSEQVASRFYWIHAAEFDGWARGYKYENNGNNGGSDRV